MFDRSFARFGEPDVREVTDRNSRLLSPPLITEQPSLGPGRADSQKPVIWAGNLKVAGFEDIA
jgi:hypothetical protein